MCVVHIESSLGMSYIVLICILFLGATHAMEDELPLGVISGFQIRSRTFDSTNLQFIWQVEDSSRIKSWEISLRRVDQSITLHKAILDAEKTSFTFYNLTLDTTFSFKLLWHDKKGVAFRALSEPLIAYIPKNPSTETSVFANNKYLRVGRLLTGGNDSTQSVTVTTQPKDQNGTTLSDAYSSTEKITTIFPTITQLSTLAKVDSNGTDSQPSLGSQIAKEQQKRLLWWVLVVGGGGLGLILVLSAFTVLIHRACGNSEKFKVAMRRNPSTKKDETDSSPNSPVAINVIGPESAPETPPGYKTLPPPKTDGSKFELNTKVPLHLQTPRNVPSCYSWGSEFDYCGNDRPGLKNTNEWREQNNARDIDSSGQDLYVNVANKENEDNGIYANAPPIPARF